MKKFISVIMSFVMLVSVATFTPTQETQAASANLANLQKIATALRDSGTYNWVDAGLYPLTMYGQSVALFEYDDKPVLTFRSDMSYFISEQERLNTTVSFSISIKDGKIVDDRASFSRVVESIDSPESNKLYVPLNYSSLEKGKLPIFFNEDNTPAKFDTQKSKRVYADFLDCVAPLDTLLKDKIGFGLREIGFENYGYTRAVSLKLSENTFVYSGSNFCPKFDVIDEDGKVILQRYYTTKWSQNRAAGKATVTITCKGDYKGTLTASFIINPNVAKLSSVKKKGSTITIQWKKQTGAEASGYEVLYSTDKSFKKSVKSINIKKNSTAKATIKKINKKKKYYIKIRTYKTVGGVKYFSTWSNTIAK